MERYGGSGGEPQSSDPSTEAETGLEEATWRLGLEGAKSYPERPDEADCIHYLRTGFCGYGANCRFNHPPERGLKFYAAQVMGAARAGTMEYPERAGQPLCQYYMRTGTCKFGASCKFNHPKQGAGSAAPVSLNYYGYPLRPTGECKFGATCKFHHPQPADIPVSAPLPVQHPPTMPTPFVGPALYPVQSSSVHSSQPYGFVVARPSLLPSYGPGPYGPVLVSPGMVQYPGWSPYQGTVNPGASPTALPTSASSSFHGMAQFSPSTSTFPGPYQPAVSSAAASSGSQKEQSYPQRPGQPECQYYLKTGDCKFGSSCRYHHPMDLTVRGTSTVLSSLGLPLRPGASICTHFQQHGVCKFGRACKFDHPMRELSYSPSASSLTDMPVAPHPVGSFLGTLAPSSSSSDLRPEVISGATNVDSASTRAFSSMSTSSASVCTIPSKDEPGSSQRISDQNPSVISKNTEDQGSS
ncbi:hypothetical protein CDL15_Pgr011393 [Punica granatum]|uniref:C3H1-type domain-containing protein n=1 Tax=Punica granatum TaxID=22663 RepID=A0A218WF24_PUNGR|nr:hypothetical protein CDL15_Pgr011393 [Punica granatum]